MTSEQRARMQELFLADYRSVRAVEAAIDEVQAFTATDLDLMNQGAVLENLYMRRSALLSAEAGTDYGRPRKPRKPRRQRRLYEDVRVKQAHVRALGLEHTRLEKMMQSKLVRAFSQQVRVAKRVLRQQSKERGS